MGPGAVPGHEQMVAAVLRFEAAIAGQARCAIDSDPMADGAFAPLPFPALQGLGDIIANVIGAADHIAHEVSLPLLMARSAVAVA